MRLGRRFRRLLGDFQNHDGSNLRPKRAPSWSQHGTKSDAKIDQKIDAFQERFFEAILVDVGRENGGKLAPKSEPKSILALKRKNQLNVSPLVPHWVRRVVVENKKH